MSDKLTDDSPMPYGKYGPDQGDPRTMANVPDDYLRFHYDQQLAGKMNRFDAKRVEEYCIENADVLKIKIFKRT